MLETLNQQLEALADANQAAAYQRFFKTGPGQYGQGDSFLGITVPQLRKLARNFIDLNQDDLSQLLESPEHEKRLIALIILRRQYESNPENQAAITAFYLKNRQGVNNWDLVDASAPYLLGGELAKGQLWSETVELSQSPTLWDRRIAIVATLGTIRQGNNQPTLEIATLLVNDQEDLIQKATGWMLREAGKKNLDDLCSFLDQHSATMPRTMLRYSIERLAPDQRDHYMQQGRSRKNS